MPAERIDLWQGSHEPALVEVAGIEPRSTIWNRREPLVSRTKPQERSGPVGKHVNQPLTPSTNIDFPDGAVDSAAGSLLKR